MTATTQAPIDWRSMFMRYLNAVLDDSAMIGARCLTDPLWCPNWTPAESKAVAEVLERAWALRPR